MLVPSDCPLRAFRPSPYSKQCCPHLPVQPPLAGVGCKCREFWLSTWSLGLFIYFSSWLCWPLRFQNSPQTPGESVSWCLETSPLLRLPPWDGSPSLPLLSLFLSFIFCPTSFQRHWAAFLGASCPLPAFRSCFGNLLSVQMFFQWTCEGESGLPVLFLCHLRTTPPPHIIFKKLY